MTRVTDPPHQSQVAHPATPTARGNSTTAQTRADHARVTLDSYTLLASTPLQTQSIDNAELPIPGYSESRTTARRLDVVRQVDPHCRPSRVCGQPDPRAPKVVITRRLHGHVYRARVSSIWRCGNANICPICADRAARKQAARISNLVRTVLDGGGGALFLSNTVGHTYLESFATVADRLADVGSVLTNGRYAISRTLPGYLGAITTLEVTHGRNGWHPHHHRIIFLDHVPDPATIAAHTDRWRRLLVDRADAVGVHVEAAHCLDVQIVDHDAVGAYVAKIAHELADTGNKATTTPWALLDPTDPTDRASLPTAHHVSLWRDYVHGIQGRRRWSTTVHLVARIEGALGVQVEPVVVDEGLADDEPALEIESQTWRRLDHADRVTVAFAYAMADKGKAVDAGLHALQSVVIIA